MPLQEPKLFALTTKCVEAFLLELRKKATDIRPVEGTFRLATCVRSETAEIGEDDWSN